MSAILTPPHLPTIPVPRPVFQAPAALRTFTVAEYHKMIDMGLLTDEDKVELLEGYLVLKMPRNPPHDSTVTKVNKWFVRTVPDGWVVRGQVAATLAGSQPEPDLVVARGADDAFDARHPGPADLALVLEVADSSLDRDRNDKSRIYARESIPVYWIVNVVDRQIEVYTDPTGPVSAPVYRRRQDYPAGATVPVVLDGTTVGTLAVDDVLP